METPEQRFLRYYNDEMSYLRHSGRIFAHKHPKIAHRLDFGARESSDPHTERLLESFAFMASRLHQAIDDRSPELASILLECLYPHLMNPQPSIGIVQFQMDQNRKPPKGYTLPVHTPLFTYAKEGAACRFRTAYSVKMWPIRLTDARCVRRQDYGGLDSRASEGLLCLTFQVHHYLLRDINLDEILFHILGDRVISLLLYDCFFAQRDPRVYMSFDRKTAHELPRESLYPMGFDKDELLLPAPPHTSHAYLLMQEYFHFSEKFLFFKIRNLNSRPDLVPDEAQEFQILITLAQAEKLMVRSLVPENFPMGCTPVVNLFPKTTDPFRLTHRKTSYRLVPDQRRDRTTEIYSIQNVKAIVEGHEEPITIPPYFAFHEGMIREQRTLFWVPKRVSASERDVPGTDMMLSFVDMHPDLHAPPQNVIFAETLCTNRFLATQVPAGGELSIEDASPIHRIVCIKKPVDPTYSALDGDTLWQVISQLNLNYLGLMSHPEVMVQHVKQLLKLFAGTARTHRYYEIEGLQDLGVNSIVRRFGHEAWRGFVEGAEIHLFLSNPEHTGNSGLLMSSVIREYFALNVMTNSFVEIVLHDSKTLREWMRWRPRPGERTLL